MTDEPSSHIERFQRTVRLPSCHLDPTQLKEICELFGKRFTEFTKEDQPSPAPTNLNTLTAKDFVVSRELQQRQREQQQEEELRRQREEVHQQYLVKPILEFSIWDGQRKTRDRVRTKSSQKKPGQVIGLTISNRMSHSSASLVFVNVEGTEAFRGLRLRSGNYFVITSDRKDWVTGVSEDLWLQLAGSKREWFDRIRSWPIISLLTILMAGGGIGLSWLVYGRLSWLLASVAVIVAILLLPVIAALWAGTFPAFEFDNGTPLRSRAGRGFMIALIPFMVEAIMSIVLAYWF